jgi:hypothetical protein
MAEPVVTTDVSPYPLDMCGSCKAPIFWAATENGAKMPIDAEPVDPAHGGGNVTLTDRPGMLPLARVHAHAGTLFGVRVVYRSHFVTCPFAARYRRPRTGRSRP